VTGSASDARHLRRLRRLLIRLPEGVEFSQPLAGPVSRLIAMNIDFLVLLLFLSLLQAASMGFNFLPGGLGGGLSGAVFTVAAFAFQILYGIACEAWWRGQTIGKRVVGIRVVDAGGLKLRPSQAVVRNLLRAVDSLPALSMVGGIAVLLSPRFQRLGDIAAGTVVIRSRAEPMPDLDQWLGERFNSLAAHPHLAARLRQTLTPDEARLALRALMRRESLAPAARLEVYRQLAQHLRSRVRFPAEVWDGVSDEQAIRNVVDVLFRPR
jgi:uncharacterized RDD family membrane protein YckC